MEPSCLGAHIMNMNYDRIDFNVARSLLPTARVTSVKCDNCYKVIDSVFHYQSYPGLAGKSVICQSCHDKAKAN